MKAPWKAFFAAVGALLAALSYIVWKALADKRGLEKTARALAVQDVGFYAMDGLKTPEEHEAKFNAAVEKRTEQLTDMQREEVKLRFERVFGSREGT